MTYPSRKLTQALVPFTKTIMQRSVNLTRETDLLLTLMTINDTNLYRKKKRPMAASLTIYCLTLLL